jgi:hypothetical protein
MRVLAAHGSELEREFAYGVVRQLFERVLAGADKAQREDLLAGAARQVAVLFDRVDASGDGADMSFALLHRLLWLAANLAQSPLMLVIDDLHWSDRPSLRFLAYLMPRLDGLPLLLVVALRPAEPVVDQYLLAQVATEQLATVVRPAPLSEGASAQLVRTVLGEGLRTRSAAPATPLRAATRCCCVSSPTRLLPRVSTQPPMEWRDCRRSARRR